MSGEVAVDVVEVVCVGGAADGQHRNTDEDGGGAGREVAERFHVSESVLVEREKRTRSANETRDLLQT
jgi:hypothetical protein